MTREQGQSELIQKAHAALEKYESRLREINQKIWSNPELSFEEHSAHDNICDFFTALGEEYQVKRKAYGINTAFEINHMRGQGGRVVAFNAEYDALPGIGHACGHNLIATSSIAAFLATCDAMDALYSDDIGYSVRLLGTPAEEGGGGKLLLINAGAYKDVDACFMVHPFPVLPGAPDLLSSSSCAGQYLANDKVEVTFTGKPAHASAAPWEGVNALDAVVAAYVNISMLRQQILPTQKIHGVVLRGGERPNVIPASTTLDYYIRSDTVKTLKPLTERVLKCFEAAATATGCTVEYEWEPAYKDMKFNRPICQNYTNVMNAMGYSTIYDAAGQEGGLSGGSTDMGNVSYEVPGFHGGFYIQTDGVNHTPEFTAGAGSEEGFKRSLYCAAGMAVVGCQMLTDDVFAAAVQADFKKTDDIEL
ncbi:Peptidase M20D amidohydrolase predicted [Penicillium macrosclerotiorum]|uniref:Peptidase M20D amidohydrolase predicted n=1 Tax=Penicillium macrosclerotiorum TaxID=303699 RepID=UPI002547C16C|nr:Peptidase M20D amidohydrolase predicted [Penicillium macrosclerotiorum]KAJ5691812.1 Peptidase M20D amidohydrolase predicted [Penicillium macrosclerotiorum]